MKTEIAQWLIELNARFYEQWGDSFAASRQRVQPGIQRIFQEIKISGHWLDPGCGNGIVLSAWAERAEPGSCYTGFDFSAPLLAEAENRAAIVRQSGYSVHLQQINLIHADWENTMVKESLDGVICFATIHHIPGLDNRRVFFQKIHQVMKPGSPLLFSCWQPQNSPKLVRRIQSWEQTGLTAQDVDEGDVLLDWMADGGSLNQEPNSNLRYVHIYSQSELDLLAETCGFQPLDSFRSDGAGGKLGWYHHWVKKER